MVRIPTDIRIWPWSWAAAMTMAVTGLVFCAGAPQPQLGPAMAICLGLCLGSGLLLEPPPRPGMEELQILASEARPAKPTTNSVIQPLPTTSVISWSFWAREFRLSSMYGLTHIGISPRLLPTPF